MEDVRSVDIEPVERETAIHRIVDWIAAYCGSIPFLASNTILYTVWLLINTVLPQSWHFDPYPYSPMTTFLSLEAIALTIFVLISQNRQALRDRAHDEEERKRQQALMQEDVELNRKEEEENVNILALINEVKTAQAEHREILDMLAQAIPTRKR